jgi:hypothetical protein
LVKLSASSGVTSQALDQRPKDGLVAGQEDPLLALVREQPSAHEDGV